MLEYLVIVDIRLTQHKIDFDLEAAHREYRILKVEVMLIVAE